MTDRFAHHEYLLQLAQEDVAFLLRKDRSYGASWKLAGGRSAWFMLRRKMDRMIEMMRRPDPPQTFRIDQLTNGAVPAVENLAHLKACYNAEDIFAKIEEDPTGQDGCVLAEVRDLRRYLLLVEAEMYARGVFNVKERVDRTGQDHPYGYDPNGDS